MAELIEPGDAATVAATLKRAGAEGLAVAVRGAGTKDSWSGPASSADVILSTLGLNGPVDHVAGDLVATVPAGASLDAVNAVLRRERQCLPLDPPSSGRATIGGIVAANDSGPRRHRYGTPRDLIIGIDIALPDGRIAKAGGRVVKNVAGYDLSKLLCGSHGSLAVITSATFKLAPMPAASSTLVAEAGDAARLGAIAMAIAHSPLTPSTIELQSPPHRLLVRFETSPRATEQQIAAASALCAGQGVSSQVFTGQSEADLWREHEQRLWPPAGTIVKLACLPSDVGAVLLRVEALALAKQILVAASGRAGLGVMHVRLDGDPPQQAALVSELRRELASRGGSAVLVSAAPELRSRVATWGANGDAAAIMRAVKARFDPRGILNPGREPWESRQP
jgi:glycolate oxidase FAD binding subunit